MREKTAFFHGEVMVRSRTCQERKERIPQRRKKTFVLTIFARRSKMEEEDHWGENGGLVSRGIPASGKSFSCELGKERGNR